MPRNHWEKAKWATTFAFVDGMLLLAKSRELVCRMHRCCCNQWGLSSRNDELGLSKLFGDVVRLGSRIDRRPACPSCGAYVKWRQAQHGWTHKRNGLVVQKTLSDDTRAWRLCPAAETRERRRALSHLALHRLAQTP